MVTTEELLKKKNAKSKLFKKVAYKPWELSFLTDEEKLEHVTGSDTIISSVVENNDTRDLPSESTLEELCSDANMDSNLIDPLSTSAQLTVVSTQIESVNIEKLDSVEIIDISTDENGEERPFLENKGINSKVVPSKIVDKHNKLLLNEPVFRAQSLLGIPKAVIFNLIKMETNRDENFIYCASVSTNELAMICKSTYKVVTVALTRLKKRGYLFSVDGKRGRGGYSIYSIPLFVVNGIEKWIEQQTNHLNA